MEIIKITEMREAKYVETIRDIRDFLNTLCDDALDSAIVFSERSRIGKSKVRKPITEIKHDAVGLKSDGAYHAHLLRFISE